jgi:hypothetical protein
LKANATQTVRGSSPAFEAYLESILTNHTAGCNLALDTNVVYTEASSLTTTSGLAVDGDVTTGWRPGTPAYFNPS